MGLAAVFHIPRFLMMIAMVPLVVMVAHVVASVIIRYVVGVGLPGVYVIVGNYYMTMIGFLALALALRHGEHIRLTGATDWLPPRWKRSLEAASLLLSGVVVAIVGWFAFDAAILATARGLVYFGDPPLPIWFGRWMYPIGFGALAMEFVRLGILALRQPLREVSDA